MQPFVGGKDDLLSTVGRSRRKEHDVSGEGSELHLGILLVDTPGSTFELVELGDLGNQVEAAGFYRVGVSDHLVAAHIRTFDPIVCLSCLAAATSKVRVAVQVLVLPLRHPIQVAHAFTSLDQLSEGRIELGVGVGGDWPIEFDSVGVDLHRRGERTDEALAVMLSLWERQEVTFEGKHFRLKDLKSASSPVQRPHPPIVIGGRSERALARAAKLGNRWDGIFLDASKFASRRMRLDELSAETGREVSSGMVIWTCAGEPRSSRGKLATALEGFYRLPFERFARYAVWGDVDTIKERLLEYKDAGASEITLIPVGNLSEQVELLSALLHERALQEARL